MSSDPVFTPSGPAVDADAAAALRARLRVDAITVEARDPVGGCDHYAAPGDGAMVLGVTCEVDVYCRHSGEQTEVLLLVARCEVTTELGVFFPDLPGADESVAPLLDAGVAAPVGFFLSQVPLETPTWLFVYSTLEPAALAPIVVACAPAFSDAIASLGTSQSAGQTSGLLLDSTPKPAQDSLAASVFDSLAALDAALPFTWTGAVFERDELEIVALDCQVLAADEPLALGPMQLSFLSVRLEAQAVPTLTETRVVLEGTVDVGSSAALELAASWPVRSDDLASFEVRFDGAPASLLPAGVSVPDGLLPDQASIACRVDTTTTLAPRLLALDYCVESWEILGGLLTLDSLEVSLSTPLGDAPGETQASFSAASSLGRAQLRCAGALPSGDLSFSLESTDPLTLADLGVALFGGADVRSLVAGPVTSFGLTTLAADANMESGAWTVVVGLSGDWQILSQAKHGVDLSVHSLDLVLGRPPQDSLRVTMAAQGVVGTLGVTVEGMVDTGTGAWGLAASAQAEGGATLTSLGLRGLPDWAASLRLHLLEASLDSGSGSFRFATQITIPLGGDELGCALTLAKTTDTLEVYGLLTWAGLSLSLEAFSDATRSGFVCEWRADSSLSLGELLGRISADFASVMPDFSLSLTAVSVGAMHLRESDTWLMGLTIGEGEVEWPAVDASASGFVMVIVDPIQVSELLALLPGALDELIDLSAVELSGLRLEVSDLSKGLFRFDGTITGLDAIVPDFLPAPTQLDVSIIRDFPDPAPDPLPSPYKPSFGGSVAMQLSDLEIPALRFALRGLSFGVEKDPGGPTNVVIRGLLEIGSLELQVEGSKTGSDWILDIQSAEGLSLLALAEPGLDAVGVPQGVIDFLPELALERVRVTLGKTSRKLEIVGKGGSPTLTIDQSKTATTIALTGKVTEDISFSLSYETKSKTGSCSITYQNFSLLGLMAWALQLARPSMSLDLPPPWGTILDHELGTVSIGYTFGTGELSASCETNLSFEVLGIGATISKLGIDYAPAKSGKPAAVAFVADGDFSFLELFDPSLNRNQLGWDLANESPPAQPGPLAKIFDLHYLGLGQHVAFEDTSQFTGIVDVIAALKADFVPPEDGANPIALASGLRFRADSNWFIGASFLLLDFLALDAIWNDPDLYGLRISLSGPTAGSFDGLVFEILYQKVAEGLGKYHIDFVLPAAFRTFEFGVVSVTLPALTLDVFTNGNFKVDLGFPHGGNFDRSGAVQVLPFIGKGGFYFGLLEGRTSDRVPAVSNGEFKTVIEVGIGLSIGVGKEIDKGILSGGATLTLDCIIEGVLAWFEPYDPPHDQSLYYRIDGMARLRARVWGKVDFKIVSASFEVEASATFTLRIEAYEPILIDMEARVSVRASVKVAFVRVRFRFSTSIKFSFSIGSRQQAPWIRAAANSAVGRVDQGAISALASSGDGSTPLDPVATTATIPLRLIPMFTAEVVNASSEAHCIALLVLDAQAFAALAERLLRDLIGTQVSYASSLADLDLQLSGSDPAQLEFAALSTTLDTQKVVLEIAGRDPEAGDSDAIVFPIPPQLTLRSGDHESGPDTHMVVSETYVREVRDAWTQADAQAFAEGSRSIAGTAPVTASSDTDSLPSVVFRDWFGIVARGLVDLCRDVLAEYEHSVVEVGPGKSQSITEIHTDVPWGASTADEQTWGLAFLQANRDRSSVFRPGAEFLLSRDGQTLTLTFTADETLREIIEAEELSLSDLIAAGILEEQDLLATGASVILPELERLPTLELIAKVVADARLSDVSGLASRTLLAGMRLPEIAAPSDPIAGAPWQAIYDLTGQEFVLALDEGEIAATDIELSLPIADAPSWLRFGGFNPLPTLDPDADPPQPTPHASISLSDTERSYAKDLSTDLSDGKLDAIDGQVEALPALAWEPLHFSLERGEPWRQASQPTKILYTLPGGLLERVATMSPTSPTIGGPIFQLVCGVRPRPGAALTWRDPGAFAWATWIELRVRQVGTSGGTGGGGGTAGTGYVLLGATASGAEQILGLLSLLGDAETLPADAPKTRIHLLAPADDGGWTSATTSADSFLIETNPESATGAAATTPVAVEFGEDPRPLLRMLWKATTSAQGGFLLRYVDVDGKGLPDAVFSTGVQAKVRLLVESDAYRAARGTSRDLQPTLLPVHNCVLLDAALDPEIDRLAVRARSHVVRQLVAADHSTSPESEEAVARSLGFEGTAQEVVAALRAANAYRQPTSPPVAGERLAPAPDVLVPVPSLPPGGVGFRLLRDDPTAPANGDEHIDAVFSLLTCKLESSLDPDDQPYFEGSAFEGPSKPLSPTVASEDDDDGDPDPRWRYERGFEPYRHLAARWSSANPSDDFALLADVPDPYAGVAQSATLLAKLAWGDLFGNVHDGSNTGEAQLDLRYTDPLRPLHSWPGCALSWWVSGEEGKRAPSLELQLSFDAQPFTLDADADPTQAAEARTEAAAALRVAYFQHRTTDIAFRVETSLGATDVASPRSYELVRDQVLDIARGGLLVLAQLDATEPVRDVPASAEETLAEFAARNAFEVAALTAAIPELSDYEQGPLPAELDVALPGRVRLVATPSQLVVDQLGTRPANSDGSLAKVADAHGLEPIELAIVNATLVGFVTPEVVEDAFDGLARLGTGQTLANLYRRWIDIQTTAARSFADFVDAIASLPNAIPDGPRYLLPAPRKTLSVALGLETPAPLFAIDVTLVAERTRPEYIDADVRDVASMKQARTTIAPNHDQRLGDHQGIRALAALFEAAYAFPEAQGAGVFRYEGVKLLHGKEVDVSTSTWGLRLSSGREGYDDDYWYDIPKRAPTFFAVRPLATRALSGRVDLRAYPAAEQSIDDWITNASKEPNKLDDVDLDAWARGFLRALDLVLTPEYALGARRVDASAFEQLVRAKQALAVAIARGLSSVLVDPSATSDVAEAQRAFEQRLLVQLERAYTIDTLLQVPVATTAPASGGTKPLRFIGELANVPIVAGKDQTLAQLGASLSVTGTYLASVLADAPELFVDRGPGFVPDASSKLVEGVVLPLTQVIFPKPLDQNLSEAIDFFNLSEAMLREMVGAQDTSAQVVGVDRLPAYNLGSAELALDGTADGHITSFLDVLREGKERKVFFNLDYVVRALRHRIEDVAEIGGAERSSELRFILPLDAASDAAGADIGQVEVPLPLRDTPEAPVILRHLALTEPPEPPTGSGPPTPEQLEAWILSLDDWTYRLQFSHETADQDLINLHVEFDNDADALGANAPAPDDTPAAGREPGDTLVDWLAQYRHLAAELEAALADLPALGSSEDPDGSPAFVALQRHLRLLARLSQEIAGAWDVWVPPAPVPAATMSNYELFEFTLEVEEAENLDLTGVNLAGDVDTDSETFVLAYTITRADGQPPIPLTATSKTSFDVPVGTPALKVGAIASHELDFTELDVLERSSARSGLRVTRNANLVTGATVSPDFIYQSPLVETPGIVQPYVQHLEPVELPGDSLQQTLSHLFAALFTTVPDGGTREVAIRVAYCYDLVDETSLAPRVPLRNRARFPMTKQAGEDDPFIAEVVEALTKWETDNAPSAPGGCYSFHLVVYDRPGDDDPQRPPFRRPILELADLRAPLVFSG